jgi:hypothetical protein
MLVQRIQLQQQFLSRFHSAFLNGAFCGVVMASMCWKTSSQSPRRMQLQTIRY